MKTKCFAAFACILAAVASLCLGAAALTPGELLDAIGENDLAAAYLTEDRRIRLLLAKPGDLSRPLPCRTRYVAIDEARLAALDLADWEQLGDFFSQLFRDSRFRWSRFGRQPFRPEYTCQIDDAFVLVD